VEYNRLAKDLKDMENRESFEVLKSADVVAMTTTGAAKYRDIIYKLVTKVFLCLVFEKDTGTQLDQILEASRVYSLLNPD